MKVLITGASGRIGRAIHARLRTGHEVIGYDLAPSATADVVASVEDAAALRSVLRGIDAVVHTAALHAPHVGLRSEAQFESINVRSTAMLLRLAVEAGIRRFVFTSTTALYGSGGMTDGKAAWVTEETLPRPLTIYHRTKIAAEKLLEAAAANGELAVTAIRMSRCFPEPAPLMAVYRLHRGVDARDVADAHAAALESAAPGYRRYVISGRTPFAPEDATGLAKDAHTVLARRAPDLVAAFAARGWPLPRTIDRVYDSSRAGRELGWHPRFGFHEVLAQLDRSSPEVLAPQPHWEAQE